MHISLSWTHGLYANNPHIVIESVASILVLVVVAVVAKVVVQPMVVTVVLGKCVCVCHGLISQWRGSSLNHDYSSTVQLVGCKIASINHHYPLFTNINC